MHTISFRGPIVVLVLLLTTYICQSCKTAGQNRATGPKTVNYNQYTTYTLADPPVVSSGNPVFSWPQLAERIRRELAFSLPAGGLEPADTRADLAIYYYAIIQPVGASPTLPYHLGWAAEPFIISGERFERYPANTLVIDFVDTNTQELVWRGSTALPFDNPDRLYEVLPDQLGELIQRYPSLPEK